MSNFFDKLFDVRVEIEGEGGEFSIKASFPGLVPLTAQMGRPRAERLHQNVSNSMTSRLHIFNNLLNLIARKGKIEHWQELDVCLTALAVLLEKRGLDEALECIRPAAQGVASMASGSRPGN